MICGSQDGRKLSLSVLVKGVCSENEAINALKNQVTNLIDVKASDTQEQENFIA